VKASILALVLFCGLCRMVQADPITYELTGTGNFLGGPVSPVSMEVAYDPSAVDECSPATGSALYFAFSSLTLNIGNYVFKGVLQTGTGNIQVNIGGFGCGGSGGTALLFFVTPDPLIPGVPLVLNLFKPLNEPSPNPFLTGIPPDISGDLVGGYSFEFSGGINITDVHPVTEPTTVALGAVGLFEVFRRRCRRGQKEPTN
jgi:hypothetical protein